VHDLIGTRASDKLDADVRDRMSADFREAVDFHGS